MTACPTPAGGSAFLIHRGSRFRHVVEGRSVDQREIAIRPVAAQVAAAERQRCIRIA